MALLCNYSVAWAEHYSDASGITANRSTQTLPELNAMAKLKPAIKPTRSCSKQLDFEHTLSFMLLP